ncbi:HNH endonuclease [Caulobacter sp. FWC26]|uniref:HNH endonuclease n=1 Tax=Caulobacter sp. FWC26 TaxID=69665 RepID=UPI001AEF903D|nr:HNH endonuclease [Caulobacter sp. FWC26]
MALGDLDAKAVTRALDEFDAVGRAAFLAKYGFGEARSYFVRRGESLYDSKAIAGAAHGYLGLGAAPLKPEDFSGGDATVARVLKALGFDVVRLGADKRVAEPEADKPGRNPPWTRDELILALDLYLAHEGVLPDKRSSEIAELSALLNRLSAKIHPVGSATFRNQNGTYMKLGNFRRLDPRFTALGKKGLSRGNKDEEVVWEEFAGDREKLKKVAQAIREAVDSPTFETTAYDDLDEVFEAPEGRVLTRVHRTRERNRKLVDTKKAKVFKATGKLICEACDFDFEETYGSRGRMFIEAHHTKPVEELGEEGKTHIDDLALLCSNCHRMIHVARPWLSVEELRAMLRR